MRAFLFRRFAVLCAVALLASAPLKSAVALPSFAIQTGNPCAACHVGAYGPQLTSFGRDFKLYGYVSSDKKDHFPPISVMVQTSYARTQTPETSPVAEGYRKNDNWGINETTIYYGGIIIPDRVGAFIQGTYDGVSRTFGLNTSDIRYVRDGTLFDEDMVWGITVNNNPTMSDIWNSSPNWGFPYASSPFSASSGPGSTPPTTLIDGALATNVVGTGAYLMWNDLLYVEANVYKQLGNHELSILQGLTPSLTYNIPDAFPYWRAALQNAWENGKYYGQVGTYGLTAAANPNGDRSTGKTDRYTDIAFDANFQWYANLKNVTADVLSAHATWIHETQSLGASSVLSGANASDVLNTLRADISYAIKATWIPTFQYFKVTGSTDAQVFNGRPNTEGWVAELGYVPWGKPDSPVNWANTRLTLQYTNYNQFNGMSAHASDNNTLFFNIWMAFGLNGI